MQRLDYQPTQRQAVIPTSADPVQARKSCFADENRHNRLFADKQTNEYINRQISKASEALSSRPRKLCT